MDGGKNGKNGKKVTKSDIGIILVVKSQNCKVVKGVLMLKVVIL
jgi:hypothetical protein